MHSAALFSKVISGTLYSGFMAILNVYVPEKNLTNKFHKLPRWKLTYIQVCDVYPLTVDVVIVNDSEQTPPTISLSKRAHSSPEFIPVSDPQQRDNR